MISLHINNDYAKKRGIGKKSLQTILAVMLDEKVDLVAGDFNGAAWRRATSANILSIIEEAFVDCDLLLPPGSTPLWVPGAVPGTWSDVCGFIKPPDSNERWRVRQHGAFLFHHLISLGIKQDRSELPPRGMAPLGSCGVARQSITPRKTQSTNYLERTFSAVPLQQTERSHKRGCKRPFAILVTGRPIAASPVYRYLQREERVYPQHLT